VLGISMSTETTFDAFCQRLSTAIRESSLSRAELAQQLGLKPATIKSWCVGRRSPTVRRLLELVELLQLEPGDLFAPLEGGDDRQECLACGQSFRRRVGYRIHLSLRAKECDEHQRILTTL
jgi:transcriptional regulator with XRE-family HTH domain